MYNLLGLGLFAILPSSPVHGLMLKTVSHNVTQYCSINVVFFYNQKEPLHLISTPSCCKCIEKTNVGFPFQLNAMCFHFF
jgi:hypothetical protein